MKSTESEDLLSSIAHDLNQPDQPIESVVDQEFDHESGRKHHENEMEKEIIKELDSEDELPR